MAIAMVSRNGIVRHHGRYDAVEAFRAVFARFLVLLAIMGVITTGMRGTQSDRMVVTSVSMSVEALLGDCPKWLPWCVV